METCFYKKNRYNIVICTYFDVILKQVKVFRNLLICIYIYISLPLNHLSATSPFILSIQCMTTPAKRRKNSLLLSIRRLPPDLRIYIRGFVCSVWLKDWERCANCFIRNIFLATPLITHPRPPYYLWNDKYFCSMYCGAHWTDTPSIEEERFIATQRQ